MQLCAGVDILNVNVLLQIVSPQLLSLSHSHTEFHTLTLTHTLHLTLTTHSLHLTLTTHPLFTHSSLTLSHTHTYSLSRSHTSPSLCPQLMCAVVNRNWAEIARSANLSNWKEVLAALVTFAGPEDFATLCGTYVCM